MTERRTDLNATSRPPPGEADVFAALRRCYDPCCREKGISVVDMGLIESVHVEGGEVRIDMVLTSGWCPFAMHLLTDMEQAVAALDGVVRVDVKIVWEPTWSPDRLSAEARHKLSLPMEQLIPLREARIARQNREPPRGYPTEDRTNAQ
jgi:metal-sulfur cluster biosynthetic enzyme